MNAREDFVAGVVDGTPVVVGNVPYGIVTGIAMVGAGFSAVQAVSASALVFGGAAQLAVADLLERSAPVGVILRTGLLVNLRLMLYSASLAPQFDDLPGPWRWGLATVLTDPVYALSITRFEERPSTARRWYYLGTAVPIWSSWVAGTVAVAARPSVVETARSRAAALED